MARVHGGTLPEEEKEQWLRVAKQEGFDRLWDYIKFVMRKEIRERNTKERQLAAN